MSSSAGVLRKDEAYKGTSPDRAGAEVPLFPSLGQGSERGGFVAGSLLERKEQGERNALAERVLMRGG